MRHTYFMTGFPGFLATGLIQSLYEADDSFYHVYFLIQPHMREAAEDRLHDLPLSSDKVTFLEGDITERHLNLAKKHLQSLSNTVTHVFHLAAIYDLAVPRQLAYEVNINGTHNVNEWVKTLSHLKRYVYFSTAYISGEREGRIYETELVQDQTFKNHYEETKYQAEVLVDQLKDELPITIIRPGIVVGHSKTGETSKFDGPYFLLNVFDRLNFLPIIPHLGVGNAQGNFVPVDYILKATTYLALSDKGENKTYHLTDPEPYHVKEIYGLFLNGLLDKRPIGTVPIAIAKLPLSFLFLRRWLRVEKQALDYFSYAAEYDTTQATEDLKDSGITCPDFKSYVTQIIQYYRTHKKDETKHVTIL